MNTTEKGITTLLRCAITGEKLALPEGFCLEEAMPLIRSHGMATLIYAGAVNSGMDMKDPAMMRLFGLYCKAMLQSEGQMRQLERIEAAFDAAGIDYMPLKGCNMKPRYPKPELRLMGDADILIRMEQYREKIVPVMEALGFEFRNESDHELAWKSPELYVELHKHVIPSYNEDFYVYFGTGWEHAVKKNGTCYAMDPEAEFVYQFTHFAKHFRDGGVGCRHVVDLWVYRRAFPDLQERVVTRALQKLGISEFYQNMCRMIAVWFQDGEWDERTVFLSEYIFSSGSWGRMDDRTIAQSIRGAQTGRKVARGRLRYLARTVRGAFFPGMQKLRNEYPILKTAPLLVPFVWIYRVFYKMLGVRRLVSKHTENLKLINQENMDKRIQMLHYVGLRDEF